MAVTSLKRSGLTSIIKYDSALAGNEPYLPNDFEHIQTITVGAGGAASVTFSNIPQDYQHLQIRAVVRSAANESTWFARSMRIRLNSDSGSNFATHYLDGNGSSASSGAATSQNAAFIPDIPSADNTASVFSGMVIDILDYASTVKNKTIRTLGGYDSNRTSGNGLGKVSFVSGLWMSTAAVSSLNIYDPNAGNLAQYSTFSLYGVK